MKPSPRIICMSAYLSIKAQKSWFRHGPFLPKPWRSSDLRDNISRLLERSDPAD